MTPIPSDGRSPIPGPYPWSFSAATVTLCRCPPTPRDYHPGDLVAWNLGGGITHIGIVVDRISPQSGRYLIVHNVGRGPQMEDVLFDWKIIGHYRYVDTV